MTPGRRCQSLGARGWLRLNAEAHQLEGKRRDVGLSLVVRVRQSMPVAKKPGDTVIGATTKKSGTFRYNATKVRADTALAQIVKLVQEAARHIQAFSH